MNKRFLVTVCCLVVGGGLTLAWLRLYIRSDDSADLTEKDLAKAYEQKFGKASPQPPVVPMPALEPSRAVRLAIGGLGFTDDARNRDLGDLVVASLAGSKGLELVERQSLSAALQELNLGLSGLVRASDAVRVGKLVRADWFLLGTEAKIGSTNSLVLRLVDARTGILYNAAVVASERSPERQASDVAEFVRQTRQNSSAAKPRVYLAIGTFEDLGLNNRQADFPAQLRGYLMSAFQGGDVTLLERECVEGLLQEVRLDLAGLTDSGSTNSPQPTQSAFWLVDGAYQSFETTNLQVEVGLELHRIFGATKRVALRGQAGEQINTEVKSAVAQVMGQSAAPVVPTRRTEVRIQMETGKELITKDSRLGRPDLVFLGTEFDTQMEAQKVARKRRNTEEAMRAFQTVLLLEPTNREAKLLLAACLRSDSIRRPEEARDYYREVIEGRVQDKWSEVAKQALSASFGWRNVQEKARWFGSVAGPMTNSPAADFYRHEAEAAEAEVLLKTPGPKAQALAETRLWGSITNALLGSVGGPMGTEDFVRTFGTNQAAAAHRLLELYPEFRSRAPQLAPYLLAAVATAQVETNVPVVLEFQQILENLTLHPDRVFKPDQFWWHIVPGVYDWSWHHKQYRMAATLLEGEVKAAGTYTLAASYTNHINAVEISSGDKIRLAYAYLGTEEWQKALQMFGGFSNQPFSIFEDGPWGCAGTVVFTSKAVDYCRGKLGLPVTRKGREFSMGKPMLQLCSQPTFTTDEQGLWVGLDSRLLHLDFDLNTNLVLDLPTANSAPITAFCLTSSNIWIGTDGQGLYDFDKTTGQFRRFTEKDGLLMDKIACLCLTSDALWIGYGRTVREAELKSEGGLGRMDLRTRQITSFMPSALPGSEAGGGSVPRAQTGTPTRASVLALAQGAPGEIWLLEEGPTLLLRRYRAGENAWDAGAIQACSSLLRDAKHIFLGRRWNYFGEDKTGSLGVSVMNLADKEGKWRDLKGSDGLPPGRVSAMTLDGAKLWVGGFDYIALVDPAADEVCAVAYVQTESVDRIQIGGGYVWAQVNCHLYRAAVPDVN